MAEKCSQDLINQKVNERLKNLKSSTGDIQRQNQINLALAEAGLPQNKLNALLALVRDRLSCDDNCLRERRQKELKLGLDTANRNLHDAPENVTDAEKKYYVFTKGKKGYQEMLFKRYTRKAQELKANALDKHSELMKQLYALNDDYAAETQYGYRMAELLKIREQENHELKQVIENEIAATETNDRKVVYEDYERDWLYSVRKGEILLYYLLIIFYLILGDFIPAGRYKSVRDWIILICVIVLPLLIQRISRLIFAIKDKLDYILENKAPKNVFVNM